MGFEHNSLAQKVSSNLLRDLRTSQAGNWATPRLTDKCILWQGIVDWPQPDISFEDPGTKATLALEFKPPNQTKREYVTGVGQMLTYLQGFEFAGLVVPDLAGDGFPIAEYLARVFASELVGKPVALFSYQRDVSLLTVRRALTPRVGLPPTPQTRGRGTFWAYWRDLSNHDVLALLTAVDARPNWTFDKTFGDYWTKQVLREKAYDWDGRARNRNPLTNIEPEIINARYALRHCNLIDVTGRLTREGLELLQVGKIYGADSDAFMLMLARRVLLDGNHLELIFWIEEQTRSMPAQDKVTRKDYTTTIDQALAARGIIAPRAASTTKTFFRDEAKLWNKLGLLKHVSGKRYFFAGEGYRFDWRKIISCIQDG